MQDCLSYIWESTYVTDKQQITVFGENIVFKSQSITL